MLNFPKIIPFQKILQIFLQDQSLDYNIIRHEVFQFKI